MKNLFVKNLSSARKPFNSNVFLCILKSLHIGQDKAELGNL